MEPDIKKTLEALLLSTSEPLCLRDFIKVFESYYSQSLESSEDVKETSAPGSESVTQAHIQTGLAELANEAKMEDRAYRVIEGPNGYQLVTAPQFAEYIRLLRGEPKPVRLSPAALETLSIVAYRQPVTRAEAEAIRGVSVDGPLNRLVDLGLVHVTGRAELPGRPVQYGTTERFLEFVGIKDLAALPAADVLSDHQIDNWIQGSSNAEELAGDRDVGLAEEKVSEKSDADQSAEHTDWRQENIENDAASYI